MTSGDSRGGTEMTLGEQIRQARENKNLSQEELAAQLGVSRQAVSKWENDSSIPQGINREMLSQTLGLELAVSEMAEVPVKKRGIGMWLGWVLAAILFLMLCVTVGIGLSFLSFQDSTFQDSTLDVHNDINTSEEWMVDDQLTDAPATPTLKSIQFYDSHQNIVEAEAGWYNAAGIESILVQWEGNTPNNIKIFCTPTGTETEEYTELLLTKSVLDGNSAALLSADVLVEGIMGHVYFELDYGNTVIVSEIYNIFNDPDFL